MSSFRYEYKGKPAGFRNTEEGRLIRAVKHKESRKQNRIDAYNEGRRILNSGSSTLKTGETQSPFKKEDRMTRLERWKAERDRRKVLHKMKKKPAFVVGVVHHKLYSPVETCKAVAPSKKVCKQSVLTIQSSPQKRVTRATEKRLMNKLLSKSSIKDSIKNSNSVINKEKETQKKQKQSIAPEGYNFKSPIRLPHMLLFGTVVTESMSPGYVSACMSPARARSASRKSSTSKFVVEEINDKGQNASIIDDKKVSDDTENSSIEAVSLKLSSDDKEKFDSSNNSNSASNSKMEENNKVLNTSATSAVSSSNNNTSTTARFNSPSEPVFFSPYIVCSRGKDNARKEQQLRRGFSLSRSLSEDIPTKDTVMKHLNASAEEEERTAQYFQFLLNKEVDRLTELCDTWSEIKNKPDIAEDAQYQINQAIGQTNLLISKKFERFRSLVSDCETGKGEMLVTCKDLQGFWDMMYMQVQDCDLRFEKLEKLRSRGWKEEDSPVRNAVGKKKPIARKKVAPTKSSSIRAFLAKEKRKMARKLVNDDNTEKPKIMSNHIPNDKLKKNENSPDGEYKALRSRSVGPGDKKFTPVKDEGNRLSLLQKVQLSQAKRMGSPLTVMKISQMCKTVEVQLDNSISYINSDQTPGKTILKQPKNSSKDDSRLRSTHKVNFDNHVHVNEVPVDEETQVKRDLAAALARIDTLDFDRPSNEEEITIKKKLSFDDISFEESEDAHSTKQRSILKHSTNKSSNKAGPATPSQVILPRRKTLRRQNALDDDDDDESSDESSLTNVVASTPFKEITDGSGLNVRKHKSPKHDSTNDKETTIEQNESIRVLRNRSITSINTPQSGRRSSRKLSIRVPESEHKENKTPSKPRKSALKIKIKDGEDINSKADLQNTIDSMNFDENNEKKRRSRRRSVKFSERGSSVSVDNKPVLPMTPCVRQSKTQSSEKKRSTFKEAFISCEMPEKPPERIRRSQNRKVHSST